MRIYPLVMGWASEATKNCQRNWWFHRQALNFLGVLDMPSVECWDLPTPSERFRCFSELIKTRFGWLCAKSRLAKSDDFASEDVQHISTYVFFHIHISTFHTHTHIYIYAFPCISIIFQMQYTCPYISRVFLSLSLSLPLSLHRPLQEFSQRLKASHWPSSPETVSASKLSGKPHHVTALAVGIFFYHLHSKCRISRLSPTRGSEASTWPQKKGSEDWFSTKNVEVLGSIASPTGPLPAPFLRGTRLSLAFDFPYNTVNSPKRAQGSWPSLGWNGEEDSDEDRLYWRSGVWFLNKLLHTHTYIYIYCAYILCIYIYIPSHIQHDAYNLCTVRWHDLTPALTFYLLQGSSQQLTVVSLCLYVCCEKRMRIRIVRPKNVETQWALGSLGLGGPWQPRDPVLDGNLWHRRHPVIVHKLQPCWGTGAIRWSSPPMGRWVDVAGYSCWKATHPRAYSLR